MSSFSSRGKTSRNKTAVQFCPIYYMHTHSVASVLGTPCYNKCYPTQLILINHFFACFFSFFFFLAVWCFYYFALPIYIHEGRLINRNTSLQNVYYNSTAPQTAASKITVKLNQHLLKSFTKNIITYMKVRPPAGLLYQTAIYFQCT